MTIETKYNIGDKVWFIDRKIHQRVIDAISVEQRWRDPDRRWTGKPVIKYWINCEWWL